MKMAVLYETKTGTTKEMAQIIVDGMQSIDGIEAASFSIEQIDGAFLQESCCVVLGTPTYLASMTGAVKNWLDGPARKYGLAGKVGGAFATADYLHGGEEIAIQGILNHLMVLGMLVYSGGGAYGKPVIHLGPVALKGHLDDSKDVFFLYGQRMAEKTKELFAHEEFRI